MPIDNSDAYIVALRNRLAEVERELESDREAVRQILESIRGKEEQAEHIVKLLEAEGISSDEVGASSTPSMSVSDMAYEVLKAHDERSPLHYRRIANLITGNGRLIPGKDPAANLVTHLSRDARFVRTARGTYGLADWGLKPHKKQRRRKRKKT